MNLRKLLFAGSILLQSGTALLPAVAAADASTLPASLQLEYTLTYGGLTIGRVTKTLAREADGSYRHSSRSLPLGAAKIFTSTEWLEEGQFEIVQGKVRPLTFLEYRVGADKPHRHSARFDWKTKQIFYEGWPTVPLPADTQDQGSILYALMLNPPIAGTQQSIHISSGKKLASYHYLYAGSETLKTVLGSLKTIVIERPPATKKDEVFRIWLATDRNNLPVRISTVKRGTETILELESIRGL